jgi:small subunit ribosomal protein S6
MNKYELVYIVDAHAPQATKDEIARQVVDSATKAEAKVVNTQVWFERQKMSFPINKVWEATYYLLNIEAKSAGINRLNGILRINEQILRFMTVKQEPKAIV